MKKIDKQSKHHFLMQLANGEQLTHVKISEKEIVDLVKKHSPYLAESIQKAHSRLDAVETDILTDPDYLVEYYQLHSAKSEADKLLNLDLQNTEPNEHQRRVEEYHKYASVGSALLYRDINFRGGSKFFTVTWPNFKWLPYCFNDKASSAKAWGANILFQHTWYRGERLYLIGAPYVEIPDFTKLNFNDKASSFASLP